MKCLFKHQWVKLPRNQLPSGKGIMGAWARLASRAAFRNGQATYCGHTNEVKSGSWARCGTEKYPRHQKPREGSGHLDLAFQPRICQP